jgi:hypothetical protein
VTEGSVSTWNGLGPKETASAVVIWEVRTCLGAAPTLQPDNERLRRSGRGFAIPASLSGTFRVVANASTTVDMAVADWDASHGDLNEVPLGDNLDLTAFTGKIIGVVYAV